MFRRRNEEQSPLGSLEGGRLLGGERDEAAAPSWEQASRAARRPRRQWWFWVLFFGFDVVVVAVVAAVLLLGGDDGGTASPGQRPATAPAAGTPGEGLEEAAGPRASPVTPEGLREALDVVRREAGDRRATTLRVARDGVQATLEGGLVIVRRDSVTTLDAPAGGGDMFQLIRVDVRAPARIDAALRRRGRRLNYAVLRMDPIDSRLEWVAFVDEGRTGFRTDAAGRGLCPLGSTC